VSQVKDIEGEETNETDADVHLRLKKFAEDLPMQKRSVIVTHSHVMRLLAISDDEENSKREAPYKIRVQNAEVAPFDLRK
jgi:broad specificity phosphatase PhoE